MPANTRTGVFLTSNGGISRISRNPHTHVNQPTSWGAARDFFLPACVRNRNGVTATPTDCATVRAALGADSPTGPRRRLFVYILRRSTH